MAKRKKKKEECNCDCKTEFKPKSPCGDGAYFLGIIGAAVYFIQTSTGFWAGALGILKAIVWPAFLIFELFKYLAG